MATQHNSITYDAFLPRSSYRAYICGENCTDKDLHSSASNFYHKLHTQVNEFVQGEFKTCTTKSGGTDAIIIFISSSTSSSVISSFSSQNHQTIDFNNSFMLIRDTEGSGRTSLNSSLSASSVFFVWHISICLFNRVSLTKSLSQCGHSIFHYRAIMMHFVIQHQCEKPTNF